MGMSLNSGGHITHGLKISMSGKWFNAIQYGLEDNGLIDYDEVERLAIEQFMTMTENKFDFGFAVDLMRKDLSIAFDEAKKFGIDLDEAIQDESAEDIRIVLVPKNRTFKPEVIFEDLCKNSDLEIRFAINFNAINSKLEPKLFS